MEIDKKIIAKQLIEYMMHEGLSMRALTQRLKMNTETVKNVIHDTGKAHFSTLLRVHKFLIEHHTRSMVVSNCPSGKLSAVQTCEIHNRIRALRGNTANNLMKFLDRLGVFELDEITGSMYSNAIKLLNKMDKEYE